MEEKDYSYGAEDKDIEILETTKEVVELKDLIPEESEIKDEEELTEYQKEFDESSKDADLVFQTEVEVKEKIAEEKNEPFVKKWKKKWAGLDKKSKILWISLSVFLVILIVALVVFLCLLGKKEEDVPTEPDIILEMDNYRYENGSLIFLNEKEEEIGSYECVNKSETLCAVATLKTEEKMDSPKRVDEDGKTLDFHSKIYFDRYVFLRDSKSETNIETMIYDIKNNETVDTVLEVIQMPEYEGYFVTKDESGAYALLQFTEEEVKILIPYNEAYEEMHMIPGSDALSMVAVKKDQNYYVANLLNQLSKPVTIPIVGATREYIKSKDASGKYQIYDYNGKKINETMYDYVELLEDIYIGVLDKNIILKNYKENIMGMPNVTLKNTNYVPIMTIKDGKILKTEQAMEYEKNGNTLNINVYDGLSIKNSSYDLREGTLSEKLAYINYFDGVLYFYGDQKKTELLGTYKCTNRNEIEDQTESLTTCMPAVDSIMIETRNARENKAINTGVIPIFYKRYAFIQDGDTIAFYDLVDQEEKAPYESVDTSSYTGLKELSFQNQEVDFIAKSKTSSKYGIVHIANASITPKVEFNKESIQKLGDYYVVQEQNEYSLYDKSGRKVTNNKPSPIVDYYKNYLKTLKDGQYHIHSFDKEITSDSYDYVELYDNFFATVLSGKLYVYSYENPQKNLIVKGAEEGLKLNLPSDKYYGQDVNAFKITFDNNYIYVALGETNGTYSSNTSYPIHPKEDTDTPTPEEPEEDTEESTPVEGETEND